MNPLLKPGMKSADVRTLQEFLRAAGHLVRVTCEFDDMTKNAVVEFQKQNGLVPDGIVGEKTWAALKKPASEEFQCGKIKVDLEDVYRMCPQSPKMNIQHFLPLILAQLEARSLDSFNMIKLAIATVYVETGQFKPLSEFVSKYNTSPGGRPFDLYDNRKDLGNRGAPDGETFKGRGFIQLTGRANYLSYGKVLGFDLVSNPELANSPKVAAAVLCEYIYQKRLKFGPALEKKDLALARKLVNGGSHGLETFKASYCAWEKQKKAS